GRVKKIGRLTNRVGVILPFEKEFYAQRGVEVDFVGHPLMDSVRTTMSRKQFLTRYHIDDDKKIIGLLPGSRSKEIHSLLPEFLAAAAQLADENRSDYVFLLPQASTISRQLLEASGLSDYAGKLDIRVITENRYDLMAACDAVVAASGTVTLELAILGTPTVTTYRVSPRTYRLGRMLVRNIDYFSLVNLVSGRKIIPELLQDEVTPENIAEELCRMLKNNEVHKEMIRGLTEVKALLGKLGASQRAAEIALQCGELSLATTAI
ncbi:MAG: lipid-A-disaccharide synthase, partial [Desulfobulbaceae bacterium]|nr:lipid-A-disaccharide synthase [Desulfobulbaceae bacterium]